VEVTESKMGSRDQDGQQDGRPGRDEPTVHIAAVGPGLPCSDRLATGRGADATDHGSDRESNRAAERNRVPFNWQNATLPGIDPVSQDSAPFEGHGPGCRRHLDLTHFDQQGVARFGADDVDGTRHRHSGRVRELLVESIRARADVPLDGPVRATV
jgi:hypothetical protein